MAGTRDITEPTRRAVWGVLLRCLGEKAERIALASSAPAAGAGEQVGWVHRYLAGKWAPVAMEPGVDQMKFIEAVLSMAGLENQQGTHARGAIELMLSLDAKGQLPKPLPADQPMYQFRPGDALPERHRRVSIGVEVLPADQRMVLYLPGE